MHEEGHRKETHSVADGHVGEEVHGVLERPESEGKTSKLGRLLRFARYVAPVVLTLTGPVAAKAALGANTGTEQQVQISQWEYCVPALNLIGMGLLGAGVAATGWASLYRKYKDKAERRQNDDLPGNAE